MYTTPTKIILTVALLQICVVYVLVAIDIYPENYDGIRLGYFELQRWCSHCSLTESLIPEFRAFLVNGGLLADSVLLLTALWKWPQKMAGLIWVQVILAVISIVMVPGLFRNQHIAIYSLVAFWVLHAICTSLERRYNQVPITPKPRYLN